MQRSKLMFLLVALALAVALAVAFGSGWFGAEPLPPPGPANGGGDGDTVVAGPNDQVDAPPLDVPPHAPHVELKVTSIERFVPPPEEPSRARTQRGDELPTRLLAGIGAGFDADPQRRGVAMARVSYPDGDVLRQVVVEPDRVLPVTVGGIVTMRGRVVDEQQKPIAGASVWFGQLDGDGGLRAVQTDEEGLYECDVRIGEGVPFVVRAPGRASTWRVLTVSLASRSLDATLLPACTLQVQLATSATDVDARAFVTPPAQLTTGIAQWPFFLQALTGGHAIDAQGRCVIDDLPADGAAGIVVRHPFAPPARAEVRLKPGLTQQIVPVRLAQQRRRGMVVDEADAALAGVAVFSHFERDPIGAGGSLRLLPPHLDARSSCMTFSDAVGAFVVGVQEGRGQVLSLRRYGHAGRDVPWDRVPEQGVVLPAWRGGDAALRVLPPRPGTAWTIATDLGGGLRADVAQDEAFRVSLPHAGIFDVEVTVAIDGEVREQRVWKHRIATDAVDVETPIVD